MSSDRNFRMAALKLHGLHHKDRDWLLQHIDSNQRAKLLALLTELDELGLISTESVSDNQIEYPVGHYQFDPNIIAELDQTSPVLIMKAFNTLPEFLKAMMLHARYWQWSPQIWAQFEAHERQRLLRHTEHIGSIKTPVFTALIETFAETIRQLTEEAGGGRSRIQSDQQKFWMA